MLKRSPVAQVRGRDREISASSIWWPPAGGALSSTGVMGTGGPGGAAPMPVDTLPQHECCGVMTPPFELSTGLLPAGIHEATWGERVARFGWTPYRLTLLAGLKAALDALRLAGCRRGLCTIAPSSV